MNPEESHDRKPYRLGVALSGGGARGFAHIGALTAIEEAGLRPDIIAGVSGRYPHERDCPSVLQG